MKKILLLLLVLSLATFCACGNSVIDDLPDDVSETANITDAAANESVDWETPIDIDDSFEQNTDEEIDITEPEVTESSFETEPNTSATTGAQNTTTQPSATEPAATEPVATEPTETEPVATTRPNSSGPIELPMIPG